MQLHSVASADSHILALRMYLKTCFVAETEREAADTRRFFEDVAEGATTRRSNEAAVVSQPVEGQMGF